VDARNQPIFQAALFEKESRLDQWATADTQAVNRAQPELRFFDDQGQYV
jgi:hypothetical protein